MSPALVMGTDQRTWINDGKFGHSEELGKWIVRIQACQRPFKCSYCPYSASQKGNLKTHVLCVHRMPFDNSQYPDRRFKRSRPESDTPEKNTDEAVGAVTSNQPMTGADGSHGSNTGLFAGDPSLVSRNEAAMMWGDY